VGLALAARAELPAMRLMPDGSKDMYIGLAVSSMPKYRGARERETKPLGLLQMQWSNGIFVSGLSLGMHMSDAPAVEYGPLLAIEPGRTSSGSQTSSSVGGMDGMTVGSASVSASTAPPRPGTTTPSRFTEVSSALEGGGFFNYAFDQTLRVTTSLLYGAGNDRNGLLLNAALQKSFLALAPHHHLSLSAGLTWANRPYLHSYFGADARRQPDGTTSRAYAPAGGVRDVQLVLNWNWELSHLWLLSSQASATRLMDDAARSPLVDRRNNFAVRTGLAYRF
jgi:outer membrane scaffolding protein for murein synthesis (MipA/OmpV family)